MSDYLDYENNLAFPPKKRKVFPIIKNILAIIGILDLLFFLYLNLAYVGYGELGEYYFDFGDRYLMVGTVKQ